MRSGVYAEAIRAKSRCMLWLFTVLNHSNRREDEIGESSALSGCLEGAVKETEIMMADEERWKALPEEERQEHEQTLHQNSALLTT